MTRKKKEKILATFEEPLFEEGELDPTEQELQEFEASFGTVSQDTPQKLVSILDIVVASDQPRKYFDEERLRSLSISIKEKGILQPIAVRQRDDGKYQVIAGERRLRAAKMAKKVRIPVIIHKVNEQEARTLQLVENLQREDLNPMEETVSTLELLAAALMLTAEEVKALLYQIKHLKAGSLAGNNVITSQAAVVERIFGEIGRFTVESFVVNRLPLLQMPEDVVAALVEGKLEYTKALEIGKKLKNHRELRAQILEEAIQSKLSIRELRERIKEVLTPPQKPQHNASQVNSKRVTKEIAALITANHLERDTVVLEILEEAERKISDYCATRAKTG